MRALAGERLRDLEILMRLPGERGRLVSADAQPITDADGHRLGAVLAVRDITDRRRAERFRSVELAVSEALRHAESVEQAGPRVLQAVCDTLGWPYAELWLVDEQTGTLIPAAQYSVVCPDGDPKPATQPGTGDALTGAAWRTGKPVWITDLDVAVPGCGTGTPRLRTGLAIPAASGDRIVAVLSFFADVVEDPADPLVVLLSGVATHIAEFLERRRALELALALARSTDEYLALIGHELRTPLTSIAAYLAMMRESDPVTLIDELPQLLEVLIRNSDTLRHIVDELLDLAALEGGHAELACEPVNLDAVAREAAAVIHEAADACGITVNLQLTAAVVRGDPGRLRQVVTHLLDNAVRHTPPGGRITVTVTRPAAELVELAVTDTGIGIPAADHEQLFTRFYRSGPTRERRIPGAGLGLAVSRAIIEGHHGSIRLIPTAAAGTRISVRLPADAC